MSSNTLRGMGSKGGGDGESTTEGPDASGDSSGDAVPAAASPHDADTAPANKVTETVRLVERPMLVSLDSPVPGHEAPEGGGTGSRSSSDTKSPSLSVTLVGVPPPILVRRGPRDPIRDQGTMQGRDVHLPADIKRLAALRPVTAGEHPPFAQPAPSASPTAAAEMPPRGADSEDSSTADLGPPSPQGKRIDPTKTLVIPRLPGDDGAFVHGNAPAPVDVSSHSPWYEQEPAGDEVYDDDPAPNLLGRIAIGAAVAAALSVVLFAIVRLRGQASAEDESEARAAVAVPRPIVHEGAPPPTAVPPGAAVPAGAAEPNAAIPSLPAVPTEESARRPADELPPGESPSRPADWLPSHAGTTRPAAARTATWVERAGGPMGTNGAPASAVAARRKPATPGAPSTSPRAGAATSAGAPARPFVSTPSSQGPGTGAASRTESAEPFPETSPPPVRPAGQDRGRNKPTYDPDSTLPLNTE